VPAGLKAAELCGKAVPRILTFGELFSHPAPPPELLRLVADFEKRMLDDANAPMPREITRALRDVAVFALQRLRATPAPKELFREREWLLAQPWLDPDNRRRQSEPMA
jgi:hypothetical protein